MPRRDVDRPAASLSTAPNLGFCRFDFSLFEDRYLFSSVRRLIGRFLGGGSGRTPPLLEPLAIFTAGAESAGTRRMATSAFAVRVASAALAWASQVLLARWMGRFDYGVFVVLWTLVVTFGVVFAFGLEQSVVTLLRRYAQEGDPGAARGLVLAGRLFAFAVASLIAAAGCLLLLVQPDLVADYRRLPLFVAAVCLPIYAVAEIQDGIAVAHGWPDLALLPTFLARPATILVLMAFALLAGIGMTALTACWVAVIATWSVTLVQTVVIGRRLDAVLPPAPRRFDVALWVRTSAPMFLVDSFVVLLAAVDILLVGRFAEPGDVAIYFATVKTLALVHFVYYAAKVASARRFATYWHAGDRAGLAAFAARVGRWTFWASLALSIVVLALGRPLLSLFGPAFVEGWAILFVLVVGVLARASVGPAETLLTMAGQQTASATVHGLTLAVSLMANAAIVPIYGIWGAAFATAGAMIVESILLRIAVARRLGLDVFVLTSTASAHPPP